MVGARDSLLETVLVPSGVLGVELTNVVEGPMLAWKELVLLGKLVKTAVVSASVVVSSVVVDGSAVVVG